MKKVLPPSRPPCVTKRFEFQGKAGQRVHLDILVAQKDADTYVRPGAEVHVVLIACHGRERNAQEMFEQAALAVRAVTGVLVIAPHFDQLSSSAPTHDGKVTWKGNKWGEGGSSDGGGASSVSSFEVLDGLSTLYACTLHKRVVLVGHSLGAQLVQRYSVLGPSIDGLTYVVINPSTYMHLDERWPYKYGLRDRDKVIRSSYMSAFRDRATLMHDLQPKRVVYMHGQRDVGVGDEREEAMRQGKSRLERLSVWQSHLVHIFGGQWPASHSVVIVPGVGHDAGKMMGSNEFLQIVQWRRQG